MPAGRPLTILSALHSLEPGGVERDVLRFTKAWREHGLDARIALGRREGALMHEAPDVPYIIPSPARLATIHTESLWMMLKLPAIVRQVKPDILFFASNGLMAVAGFLKLRLGRDCPPMVLRVSNSLVRGQSAAPRRSLQRWFMRLHSRIYAAIVAMAPPVRDEIITELGATPQQAVTIPNAALTAADAKRLADARDAAVRDHPGRHFLAIGRLAPQKDFRRLLAAFARIRTPHDRLTIIGEGAERAALEKQAQSLGIADQVEMPGHLHGVENWFASADAFILSSDFEGVPAVLVEALAAGIPIVATNCAVSIPMMVEGAGLLVPRRDEAALARAMDQICAQTPDVAQMRARAAQFTVEATLTQWSDLFNGIGRK